MRLIYKIVILDLLLCVVIDVNEGFTGLLESIGFSASTKIAGDPHIRTKRSLLNFQNVIQCLQPWASIIATYGDYGCYCGFRGHGRPLDDTDKCCHHHDKCYDNADLTASTFSEITGGTYFTDYSFDCTDNKVTCHGDINTPYQQSVCQCDRAAAECFLASRRSYSSKLYNINTGKYCGENANLNDLALNVHTLYKFYSCELEPDEDRCCLQKGYNSAYEDCCGGKVKKLPKVQFKYLRCCNSRLYDTQTKLCCHGFLYPNVAHMKCCGNLGEAADSRYADCLDGKVTFHEFTNKNKTLNVS
ncbi:uncharacterized protein LOC143468830 [Clavelina lepadiformis]|uniref:Phospholipase A2 n=1 Tax=Clavelina lepadiformis TaxID=159417 RepID=A0ABP0FW74_CLALP